MLGKRRVRCDERRLGSEQKALKMKKDGMTNGGRGMALASLCRENLSGMAISLTLEQRQMEVEN